VLVDQLLQGSGVLTAGSREDGTDLRVGQCDKLFDKSEA
jgi:hypothetical protein